MMLDRVGPPPIHELKAIHCPWVLAMQQHLGKFEIPGPKTAPFIADWLRRLHTPWTDDETPWCGVAMAGVMDACGHTYPKLYYRARRWIGYGRALANGKAEALRLRRSIPYGAICVLDRPPRATDGHVGIYVGVAHMSHGPAVILLGGNQGNAVSFATFPLSRVLYFGWPGGTLPVEVGRRLTATALGVTYVPPASAGEA